MKLRYIRDGFRIEARPDESVHILAVAVDRLRSGCARHMDAIAASPDASAISWDLDIIAYVVGTAAPDLTIDPEVSRWVARLGARICFDLMIMSEA